MGSFLYCDAVAYVSLHPHFHPVTLKSEVRLALSAALAAAFPDGRDFKVGQIKRRSGAGVARISTSETDVHIRNGCPHSRRSASYGRCALGAGRSGPLTATPPQPTAQEAAVRSTRPTWPRRSSCQDMRSKESRRAQTHLSRPRAHGAFRIRPGMLGAPLSSRSTAARLARTRLECQSCPAHTLSLCACCRAG